MTAWYASHLVLIEATFINFLLALSIHVPLRVGVFSFAGVGSYGLGAYTAAVLTLRYEVPAAVAIGAAVLFSALVGYLFSLLVARLSGLYLAMATIAFVLIIAVLATNGGELTGGAHGLYGVISDLTTGGVVVVCAVAALLLALTERGPLRRRVDAVREDPELSLSMGIAVVPMRQIAFAVSGALGACAGAMNTLLRTTVSPEEVNFHLIVLALTMVIIGGIRSWLGALIGAVIFTWLPSVLSTAGQWQDLVYGLIIILAAVFMPTGLLGLAQSGYRKLRGRSGGAVAASADGADAQERAVREALGGESSKEGVR
ncbi:branched-chain amino acid ABC transporter permease [Thermobifida halotolerans]|uniref:Branched-chain amino acid ABC transporter permease n=1 Tax=Thermobifida halotolerans TaxID=483545 RepID=A0A399G481_9ACTN|nr:branched-chain amino acid ABC transporter permease [Thermobifida halotolerans]UOE20888.1 branched-chain amino acid ABC transporter permease [Thermobifida halotolerans]